MDNEYRIYKQKVWEFLDNIEPGVFYIVSNLCVPENRTKFIGCVKSYMDVKTPFHGYITFNHDYSKLYKTDIFKMNYATGVIDSINASSRVSTWASEYTRGSF